jgi:hypothetical protein
MNQSKVGAHSCSPYSVSLSDSVAFTAAAILGPSSAATNEIAESERIKANGSAEPIPEAGSIEWDLGLRRTEVLGMQLEEDYAKGKGVFAES